MAIRERWRQYLMMNRGWTYHSFWYQQTLFHPPTRIFKYRLLLFYLTSRYYTQATTSSRFPQTFPNKKVQDGNRCHLFPFFNLFGRDTTINLILVLFEYDYNLLGRGTVTTNLRFSGDDEYMQKLWECDDNFFPGTIDNNTIAYCTIIIWVVACVDFVCHNAYIHGSPELPKFLSVSIGFSWYYHDDRFYWFKISKINQSE